MFLWFYHKFWFKWSFLFLANFRRSIFFISLISICNQMEKNCVFREIDLEFVIFD